jgi:hypothetical protein
VVGYEDPGAPRKVFQRLFHAIFDLAEERLVLIQKAGVKSSPSTPRVDAISIHWKSVIVL